MLALALVVVVAAAPREAAEVLVEVAGDTPGWQASFDVDAGVDDVLAVVGDAAGPVRHLFSGVKSVKLVAQRDAQTREYQYVVNGGMSDLSYVTSSRLTRDDKGGATLAWHRLSGDFDTLEGSWQLTPLGATGWTHVVYTTRVAMGPGFLQGLVRGGVHDAVVGIAARLRALVAKAAQQRTDPPAASETTTTTTQAPKTTQTTQTTTPTP